MVEWNHNYISAPDALAMLPQTAAGKVSWGSVKVAHLDTGYTENTAFGAWNGGRNAIVKTDLGGDFLQPNRGTAEDPLIDVGFMEPGHGTRSGSAMCADGNGFTGVAPGLPLVPFRVTNSSLVTSEVSRAIGKAIDHIVENNVAAVVNISLGIPIIEDFAMGKAIDRAYEKGVIVCAAAGQKIDRVTYPGKHQRTIGVAGIKRRGKPNRGRFSIYAKYDRYNRIDVWAPADPIRRANVIDERPRKQFGDGTTYATVHVSAAACMWLRHHGPQINSLYGRTWKRVEAFRSVLYQSRKALPFKSPETNDAGALNAAKLLSIALPDSDALLKTRDLAGDDRY